MVQGNGTSAIPTISADGSVIAYQSAANNLADPASVPSDTNGLSDVYLWQDGDNSLGSQTVQSGAANGISGNPGLSADGSALGYETTASNLGFADGNSTGDIVVRPTFEPTIALTMGNWLVGETSTLTFTGEFSSDTQIFVTGDGVITTNVVAVTPTMVEFEVTTEPSATPGNRTVYAISPALELGLPPLFGSAASVMVLLTN